MTGPSEPFSASSRYGVRAGRSGCRRFQRFPSAPAEAFKQRGLRFDDGDVRGYEIDDAVAELLDSLRRLRVLRMHGTATEESGNAIEIWIQSAAQGVSKCPCASDEPITERSHSQSIPLLFT